MNVNDTIKSMLTNYRAIFKSKADCYNQLFCVIGNGYTWVDGELVSDYPEEDKNRSQSDTAKALCESALFFFKINPNSKRHIQIIEDYGPNSLSEEIIENRLNDNILRQVSFGWYPLVEEYSYIYHIPENIKPDWLAAAQETVQLLIKDNIELNRNLLDKRLFKESK